jgi:hypothetical protein
VIDLATGSGRNALALRKAGFEVTAIDDAASVVTASLTSTPGPYAAVLSTHGLLHGSPTSITELVSAIAAVLEPGGFFYATFGSVRDERFGQGIAIEPFVFAPSDGDERGVSHLFFDETRLRSLLHERFDIQYLRERDADVAGGSWAHAEMPAERSVHWFAQARKRRSRNDA